MPFVNKLEQVMPFVNAIKKRAQDTNNKAAQHDLEPYLKDTGYMAPECYRQAIMNGWGHKYKGIYEICVTHFPDDDTVKELYNKISKICMY